METVLAFFLLAAVCSGGELILLLKWYFSCSFISFNKFTFKYMFYLLSASLYTHPVCYEPLDPGPCDSAIPSYYFDSYSGTCEFFYYSGCGGNGNRFNSQQGCLSACNRQHKWWILRPARNSDWYGEADYYATKWFFFCSALFCFTYLTHNHLLFVIKIHN